MANSTDSIPLARTTTVKVFFCPTRRSPMTSPGAQNTDATGTTDGNGGFESFNNFKPNYTSSMNYLFQFGGLDADGDPDYSHGTNPTLDERRLDERSMEQRPSLRSAN